MTKHLSLRARKQLWEKIMKIPRRKVSPEQLAEEIEAIKNETAGIHRHAKKAWQ